MLDLRYIIQDTRHRQRLLMLTSYVLNAAYEREEERVGDKGGKRRVSVFHCAAPCCLNTRVFSLITFTLTAPGPAENPYVPTALGC